ncbi:hypothetical protein MMC09_004162 [Bachmanniomyces sp. S44760]|nr:hypothetical protein [Bachmanniomyces sp. S44760]
MYAPTLISLSLLSTLAAAIPTPAALAPRSCTTIIPNSYQTIQENAPYGVFNPVREFQVSQQSGGEYSIDTIVNFTDIAAGSYGCELGLSFTNEYNIPQSGSTLLNVYALDTSIAGDESYETYFPNGGKGTPAGAYLFGSVTITGQKQIINSKACSSELSFLFEISNEDEAGSVFFVDAGDNLSGIGGLFMTFNC